MIRKLNIKQTIIGTLLAALVAPAAAKPIPVPPSKVKPVVVKSAFKPVQKAPVHRSFHYRKLPKGATFVLIAGISYAVIDNAYYKRSNDTYIYVEQPPVSTQPQIQAGVSSESQSTVTGMQGKVVQLVPENATTVTVDGATFYVDGGDWYAPIAGTSQFVIVEPQL
ncbi:hypothetical protein [Vibrio maritimus]|uniref:hypothetical protein n=1 Tax=Vibrio maritimus TaxID=990268 RepID=UPI001F414DDE|nr:hypothetical protein [Vibrio maritimus]